MPRTEGKNYHLHNIFGSLENILFIGSPGVGKTHLATAIGIEAAKNRQITYFINCNDLINNLKKAYHENRLDERLKFYNKYKLLIIDEVGFLPIDKDGANILFQLINKRYEKKVYNYYIKYSIWQMVRNIWRSYIS